MIGRLLLSVTGALLITTGANASTIYLESFSGGTALASDPLVNTAAIASYFLNQSGGNGLVLNNSNNDASTSPGQTGAPGVTAGPAGYTNGYFLVEGTGTPVTGTNNTLFASSNFTVSQNTNYTVSFALTNVNGVSPAQISLQVNGISLLSSVTALGYYGDGNALDNWQTYSATWNSGSSTSGVVSLVDNNTAQNGNDFAVDLIQVSTATSTATPEPSTFLLFGGVAIAAGLIRRNRSAC